MEYEHAWRTATGDEGDRGLVGALVPGRRRERRGYLVSGTDVTERYRHRAELERERDFLNAIANHAPSLLCLIDDEGRVQHRASNITFERLLDYATSETGGDIFWERYVVPEEADEVRARIERIVRGEPLGEHDNHWVTSRGKRLIVAWSCTPLPTLDERRLFLLSGVDVTERKRQEEEIRASRARIVEAADAARRQLERDLHDGAQQRLVGLSISSAARPGQARARIPRGGLDSLRGASEELSLALSELRELARGIHPAVLSDRGLEAALRGLASRSPVPVEVEAPSERLPEPVEAAAYFVVSEALANVAKYAQASSASVRVVQDGGRVVVEVSDDGVGGADPSAGSGLRGLADRVSALDGSLRSTAREGRAPESEPRSRFPSDRL